MSELKNCQCGCSKPHVIRHELLNTNYKYFNVACGECQITQTIDYATEEEAIAAWNTRPASPRFTEGEREAMELIGDTCDAYLHNYRFETAEYVKLYEAIAAVKQMLSETPKVHTVDCSKAEKQGGKCTGYGHGEDDEPIDGCKACPQNSLYGEDD